MDNKPEIIINSEGDGKYLLIIGDKQWRGKTLDECMAIINGKEMEMDDNN